MKTTLCALGAIIAAALTGCQSGNMRLEIEPHHDDPYQVYGSIVNRAEKARLSVNSRYQAVAMYEYHAGESYFTGLGTIVRRPHEDPVIVTVAHMFRSGDSASYFYEVLPYSGTSFDRALVSVAPAKSGMGLNDRAAWDVAVASLGHRAVVEGFYPRDGSAYEDGPQGFVGRKIELQSLVDGSEVDTVAEAMFLDGATEHAYAVEYHSRCGESGTGFTDSQGRLYILKGDACLSPADAQRVGVPEDKHFAILIGPIRI